MGATLVLAPIASVAGTVSTQPARSLDATSRRELAKIEKSLATDGARATVLRYFSQPSRNDFYLLGTGDPRSIGLTLKLLPYSDGIVALMMHSALAGDLQNNPSAILALIESGELDDQVCIPFIDAETVPFSTHQSELLRIKNILNSVHDPALNAAKSKCLHRVKVQLQNLLVIEGWCRQHPDFGVPSCRTIDSVTAKHPGNARRNR
jgi:hypothetical protein